MNPVLIQLIPNFSTFRTLNSEIGQKFKDIIWTYLFFLARNFLFIVALLCPDFWLLISELFDKMRHFSLKNMPTFPNFFDFLKHFCEKEKNFSTLFLIILKHSRPIYIYERTFLARNFGSSARLWALAIPESYSCTSRISQRQVTKQLTKITANMQNKPNLNI